MWNEAELLDWKRWALGAAVMAAAIGLLPKSRLRTALITAWTLAPALIGLLLIAVVALGQATAEARASGMASLGLLTAYLTTAWAGVALISFHVVRYWRDRQDATSKDGDWPAKN